MKICKVKNIKTIKTDFDDGLESICLLKDGRLASCGDSKKHLIIIVYDRSYKPQFLIRRHFYCFGINSLWALRNGELLSVCYKNIKVWKINEHDYELIRPLKAHTDKVFKVIELKDGRLSSCSRDRTIRIWDNYKCIKTLKEHTDEVISIIEVNNFIISVSFNNELRIWDESTYQSITIINDVYIYSENGLSKLNDNTVIVGGYRRISLIDIRTYKINHFKDDSLEGIFCLNVNQNGLVFIGNNKGEIICFDSSSNQIVFKNKFHVQAICCIIGTKDDKLISCSTDNTINIYTLSFC